MKAKKVLFESLQATISSISELPELFAAYHIEDKYVKSVEIVSSPYWNRWAY